MEDMKKRLTDAIKSCNNMCIECDKKTCEYCFLLNEYEKEAAALIRAGALMPPVKIGDTVFAVIDFDEVEVDEYTVRGVAYSNGDWYACANDMEFNKIGDALCLLTRKEADALADEMRGGANHGDQ